MVAISSNSAKVTLKESVKMFGGRNKRTNSGTAYAVDSMECAPDFKDLCCEKQYNKNETRHITKGFFCYMFKITA